MHVNEDGAFTRVHGVGDAPDLLAVLRRWGSVSEVPPPHDDAAWTASGDDDFAIPLRGMQTVVGVGLNFLAHAGDLKAKTTRLPTLFYKGQQTLIGPGEPIVLPELSERVTAEAELALVIGRPAFRVPVEEALTYVAGGCCALDQTAEDLLLEDTRLLTVSKNFPSFLALGPEIASLEDIIGTAGTLSDVKVETWLNGACVRAGTVAQMRFSPAELVSFVSQLVPLLPGDVICTGTPGAIAVSPGDVVECRVSGLRSLVNPVLSGSAPSTSP